MSTTVDVGAAEDFPEREMKVVEAGGMELGLCRWGSEIFAIRNRCPHQAAPLCAGFLQSGLTAELTTEGVDVEAHNDEPVVLCPWHRWEFSLRDGEAAWPGFRVKTYPVSIDEGRVLVHFGRK